MTTPGIINRNSPGICRDCFIFGQSMGDYLLYNGSFYKNSQPLVTADSRGLRFGDGLFETMKVKGGTILLAEEHFERLFHGLQLLQFELPPYFTPGYLAGQTTKLCDKNHDKDARVRITIFRGEGGLYDTENHAPHRILQSWRLQVAGFELNENGLVAGIYTQAQKAMDAFANLKSNNYLPYAMAALHARKQQWNDAFLLNTAGRICDASIANIFMVKDQVIYTCPLTEGCVAGVMRRYLLENLPGAGFGLQEKNITVEDLLAADEVFLTNSIKGIRWVGHCENAVYTNRLTEMIFDKLLKKV